MQLEIKNLSKTYANGVHALTGITLTIPRGMFGLLGPNGAGKSTLMRTIATLQEPDAGSIRLGDASGTTGSSATSIDVLREKDRVRQTLGYLPQEFGVYPHVTAERLLDHFAILKGITDRRGRREVVDALLHQTNLYDVRRKKLGGYSGGMRQRFGVAVALLGDPKLIIVDEPTAGLDPAERVRFLNLLSALGEDAVVILSTHIVDDVSELCSRMAIIDRGSILLEADPLGAIAALRGQDLAARDRPIRARGTRADARGDLDEASRGPNGRARLQRHAARRRLAGRRAGPRGRLLQRHDGSLLGVSAGRGQRFDVRHALVRGGGTMKLREVFSFELGYQARRPWAWVYFVALLGVILQITVEAYTSNARSEGYYFNAPFVTVLMTFTASFMGLLATAGFAGDAASRDVQLRMYPLLYTSPLRTGTFLAGRFLAAFALNALVLLSAPIALVVSTLVPWVPKDLLGPTQPGAYVEAYLLLALPNAFIATALLFSTAALSRRAMAGYLGAVVLFFTTLSVWLYVGAKLGHWTLAKALDPLALTVLSEISRTTTATQKNTLSLIDVESLLVNRAIWIGVALAALAFTHARFRFQQPATRARWLPWRLSAAGPERVSNYGAATPLTVVVPRSKRSFAFASQIRQAIAIALYSFREIAMSWGGLLLAVLTLLLVVFGPKALSHMDIPLLPTTQQMTAFVGNTGEIIWTIIPLLTVFYAGELVSREREIGLSEIADATPAPEWSRFVGRFMGLVLLFVAYQAMLMLAAMLIQVQLGYFAFEPGLYIKILFGLQLIDHVLFAMLAITVHVLVDQKYVGYLVTLLALACVMFAASMGIEHKLLIYGADTGWTFTDLRRFGPLIAPWLAFKLYWGTCAVLLAVVAKLFWVRGRERSFGARLQAARVRLTRPTLGIVASVVALVITLGTFVLYNTNVLNAYETSDVRTRRRAEYEKRYKRYWGAAQPRLTRTTLRAEIYPSQHRAELYGTYRLVNASGVPIDSIHIAPAAGPETGPATFDRAVTLVLDDSTRGHRIYALETPLAPGDSAQMSFVVRLAPRGFTNNGVDASVARNGTFLDAIDWLPAIGYQRPREITDVGQRRDHGLSPRIRRSLDDVGARMDLAHAPRVALETIVGTESGQIAVAPGKLEREWTENGRRYFHYVTDTPIRNDFALFSAAYAVREGQWRNPADSSQTVEIQILHHPSHTKNPETA